MSKYDEAKSVIISAADLKMVLNSHKGNIESLSMQKSASLATREFQELVDAIEKEDNEQIIIEAGDILNFLIGIVHNSIDNYRKRKKDGI